MRSAASGAPALVSNNNRRQPQRSVRSTASRPSNYYARALGSRGAASAVQESATVVDSAPGFFPAITHFTDGISALPKEVTRHLTMLRETEGKAFPHEQAIDELVDAINELPNPPRSTQPQTQAFLNFSLANSVNVSANVSVIDGNSSRPQTATDDHVLDDPSEKRRRLFYQLRLQLQQMIHVLDEKNHVLATANDTLGRQLARLDGTMPYIESEISEEARLGSNTHWALPHMKDLRRAAAPPPTERSRREIQAAHSLAAAAAAVHEVDIAATRSEARREAMLAKRTRHANVDSDFDERNTGRKAQTSKIRKTQEALVDGVKTTSAGALASQSHKRRRVEKVVAPAMERTASTLAGRVPAGRELVSSRDAPVVESVKRKPIKQLPMPAVSRKRQVAESPSIAASSPKRGTFVTLNKDQSPAPTARSVTGSRARQDSIHSLAQESSRGRPNNKSRMANGTPAASTELVARNVADESVEVPENGDMVVGQIPILPPSDSLKREDTEPADTALQDERRPAATPVPLPVPMTIAQSRGGSSKTSKPGTPVKTAFTDVDFPTASATAGLSRSRSTRGAANGSGSGSNSSNSNNPAASSPALASMAAPATKRSHKKGASGRKASITARSMHAPSPVPQDDKAPNSPPPTLNSVGTETTATARKTRGATTKTPGPAAEADVPPSLVFDDDDEDDDDRLSSVKDEPTAAVDNADETLDDDELPEVDADADAEADEDEPRYCICGGVSYGDMIACDNEVCPREWFHLHCVGLTKAPAGKAKWFCEECKDELGIPGSGGSGVGAAGQVRRGVGARS